MVDSILDTPKSSEHILFRRGFKYQTHRDYSIQLDNIKPKHPISTGWLALTTTGMLLIKAGYAWDGASGPARDSRNGLRAALVHDSLYQLMRMHLLPIDQRDEADNVFYRILRTDGMNRVRAWYWWRAVHRFAKKSATNPDRPVERAP